MLAVGANLAQAVLAKVVLEVPCLLDLVSSDDHRQRIGLQESVDCFVAIKVGNTSRRVPEK
jgi:hypothetical protein